MASFSSTEYGKTDFVLLDQLTEEAFMQNLKLRFKMGKIYSYIGEPAGGHHHITDMIPPTIV